jgi:hypothetical protein
VAKKQNDSKMGRTVSAQPRLHQRAREIQSYGTVKHALPLDLEEPVRVQVTNQLTGKQNGAFKPFMSALGPRR